MVVHTIYVILHKIYDRVCGYYSYLRAGWKLWGTDQFSPKTIRACDNLTCTSCAHVSILLGFGNLHKAWKSVRQNSSCFFVCFESTLSCIRGRQHNDTASRATGFAVLLSPEAVCTADFRSSPCNACACKLSLHSLQRYDILCKSCTVAVYMEVCSNRCTVISELPRVCGATWDEPLKHQES